MVVAETRTDSLQSLREAVLPRGLSTAHPIIVARAEGSRVWDVDGREYIDFAGGIGVLNVGHNHPQVVQAVKAQLERVVHTCFQVAMYEPYLRLAERLAALAPGEEAKKVILLSTGAEAVENAVKIARSATGRSAIISFNRSFHGRTLLGMTLNGKTTPYQQNFGPFAPDVFHTPYPMEYRGWTSERAIEALEELFATQVAPERVAAILIEPVMGEGGFVPAPAAFLQTLREIATRHGILLIADEVQSGFGRTSKLFAIEHSGVVPDLITVAKSLAGGLPLSAVIGRADLMDAPNPGGLGGTYAGNPLACAAALAVLDLFEHGLLDQAERLGGKLESRLAAFYDMFPQVGEARGLGAMRAIEFVRDRQSRAEDPEIVKRIIVSARERGLILLSAGLHGNVIRIHAPLTTEDAVLERGMDILEEAIREAARA
ncbi:4-aminobutyrate--2-oxoglutarate transaminase [Chloroflexia bacterium SDU3-3]|nr:4-aminobutyrate--2-oxoglutarate transaminase [Chloroflexia bacterium SDU3-3]